MSSFEQKHAFFHYWLFKFVFSVGVYDGLDCNSRNKDNSILLCSCVIANRLFRCIRNRYLWVIRAASSCMSISSETRLLLCKKFGSRALFPVLQSLFRFLDSVIPVNSTKNHTKNNKREWSSERSGSYCPAKLKPCARRIAQCRRGNEAVKSWCCNQSGALEVCPNAES